MADIDFTGITNFNYDDSRFSEENPDFVNQIGRASFYDASTGAINLTMRGRLSDIVATHFISGLPFIGVANEPDPDFAMVDIKNQLIVSRPVMSINLNGNILSGVPIGAEIYIDGQFYRAEDGEIELITRPGAAVMISVHHWPFVDWRGEYANSEA